MVHLTYRKTIKPKNRPSKYKLETGVTLYNYRDEQGQMKHKVVRYRKWSINRDVGNNQKDK